MNTILEIDNLNKSFTINREVIHVLDSISLALDRGDFLTVLGPSGCGKTTLLRCISCFEKKDTGSIKVESLTVTRPGPDRIMVFQDFNQLFHWKTVMENIVYPLNLNYRQKTKTDRTQTALYFLEMVKLSKFKNAYPNQLSGGMRQRVAIARALALRPKILLMDEPFGALDAQTRNILQNELIEIWQKTKTTIIFITHNIQESIILGNKIVVLSQIPSTIKLFLKNHLEIPRMPETVEFMDLWKKLYSSLEIKQLI